MRRLLTVLAILISSPAMAQNPQAQNPGTTEPGPGTPDYAMPENPPLGAPEPERKRVFLGTKALDACNIDYVNFCPGNGTVSSHVAISCLKQSWVDLSTPCRNAISGYQANQQQNQANLQQ